MTLNFDSFFYGHPISVIFDGSQKIASKHVILLHATATTTTTTTTPATPATPYGPELTCARVRENSRKLEKTRENSRILEFSSRDARYFWSAEHLPGI